MYEQNRRSPGKDMLLKIAKVFNVSVVNQLQKKLYKAFLMQWKWVWPLQKKRIRSTHQINIRNNI